jgi:copper chaperone CopZ
MWKHLLAIFLVVSAVLASFYFPRVPEGPDAEFRCRLPDIVCDACRGAVTAELKKEAGIRDVRFEGADRKELVVTHSARLTPEALRNSLAHIGYPAEALAGDASKAVSHQKCVCPVEQAKAQQP